MKQNIEKTLKSLNLEVDRAWLTTNMMPSVSGGVEDMCMVDDDLDDIDQPTVLVEYHRGLLVNLSTHFIVTGGTRDQRIHLSMALLHDLLPLRGNSQHPVVILNDEIPEGIPLGATTDVTVIGAPVQQLQVPGVFMEDDWNRDRYPIRRHSDHVVAEFTDSIHFAALRYFLCGAFMASRYGIAIANGNECKQLLSGYQVVEILDVNDTTYNLDSELFEPGEAILLSYDLRVGNREYGSL